MLHIAWDKCEESCYRFLIGYKLITESIVSCLRSLFHWVFGTTEYHAIQVSFGTQSSDTLSLCYLSHRIWQQQKLGDGSWCALNGISKAHMPREDGRRNPFRPQPYKASCSWVGLVGTCYLLTTGNKFSASSAEMLRYSMSYGNLSGRKTEAPSSLAFLAFCQ